MSPPSLGNLNKLSPVPYASTQHGHLKEDLLILECTYHTSIMNGNRRTAAHSEYRPVPEFQARVVTLTINVAQQLVPMLLGSRLSGLLRAAGDSRDFGHLSCCWDKD
jgi:hypothetical protein